MLSRIEGGKNWKGKCINSRSHVLEKESESIIYDAVEQMESITKVNYVLSNANKGRSTLLLFELLFKRICLL